MRKSGMSNAVANVLVILIVVIVVSLVWVFVVPIVGDGFGGHGGGVSVVISEGYTVYDSNTKLASVHIRRGDGGSELNGIDVIFSIEGESVEFTIPKSDVLEPSSVKLYKFDLSEGEPDSVKVVPTFAVGSGPVTGNVVATGNVVSLDPEYSESPQECGFCFGRGGTP